MRFPLLLLAASAFAAPDIFDAIRRGDASAVSQLAADVNVRRPDGTTPLHHAVVTADAAMVELLLRLKADPAAANAGRYTPLHYALSDLRKTKALLAAGAGPDIATRNGIRPLQLAASRKGAEDFLQALLDAGAKPSTAAVEAAAGRSSPLICAKAGMQISSQVA